MRLPFGMPDSYQAAGPDDSKWIHEDTYHEAIEIQGSNRDSPVWKTEDLGSTWLEMEEVSR